MENTETHDTKEKRKDFLLPGSILVAALLISGSIIYVLGNNGTAPDAGTGTASLRTQDAQALLSVTERDAVLGDPNAPVTFIEYGDYQCPFCGRFFVQVEQELIRKYVNTGMMSMVYRNFAFLGPESVAAAEAAECAKDQGKFWEYHDALYTEEVQDGREHNGNLNRALFMGFAQNLSLDTATFAQCIDSGKYAELIGQDYTGGQTLGVNATPTAFVNGRLLRGALPLTDFESAIQEALAEGR